MLAFTPVIFDIENLYQQMVKADDYCPFALRRFWVFVGTRPTCGLWRQQERGNVTALAEVPAGLFDFPGH